MIAPNTAERILLIGQKIESEVINEYVYLGQLANPENEKIDREITNGKMFGQYCDCTKKNKFPKHKRNIGRRCHHISSDSI